MPDRPPPNATALSIIVPTYNSARTLGRCLASITSQMGADDELIVVDDSRTDDDTRRICDQFGVHLLISPARMAESRNVGLAVASRGLLVHLDSDMVLLPGVLERIRHAMRDTSIDGLVLSERPLGHRYLDRARALDKAGTELAHVGVAARVTRRSVALAIGGYNPALEAGEDADYHRRLLASGATLHCLPGVAILHDEGRVTLWAAARKKYHYGASLPLFEVYNGPLYTLAQLMKRLTASARIALREDPLAFPGYLALLTVQLGAGLLGRRCARRQAKSHAGSELLQ
jgi:glycosyltransferase involved in cell wall biosynthesis